MSIRKAPLALLAGLFAALLVAAMPVSAAARSSATAATGGTLNVDLQSDLDYTDPSLDYLSTGWEMEYATCLKLMNYPDKNGPAGGQLIPEAAAGFPKISNGGKVYDFTVNASFTKFSNGQPVTAQAFKDVFERNADPKMQSPAEQFMTDVQGVVPRFAGQTQSVSGVTVKGNHLIIKLLNPAPDFLARVAMPFFCALPVGTERDPNGLNTVPSAGPYYIASRSVNRQIVLKRNPYYKGKRPHNVSQIVYTIGNSLDASYLRVDRGESDYAATGLSPATYAQVAQKYGINKKQFWVKPILSVSYLAMNTSRGIFKNNLPLRKAVNYAIDRKALLVQSGYLAGGRTDQILPPGLAGFRDANLYPLKGPDLVTAKKLAAGHTGDGKAVLYTGNTASYQLRAALYQYQLKQIGIDVNIQQFARGVQITKTGLRNEPFDMSDTGWIADYPDPYDFINVLLDGSKLQDANNVNVSYFNDPKFNKDIRAASLLSGDARYKAYGNLDVNISLRAAPWASRANSNARMFVSKRVGCFTYTAAYQVDIAALCLNG
jgi:ABC-type oligopeptide transport system substrate-binding subunit